jgi:hypothetical protein
LHVEGALNQHFPFGLAVGVGGYYCQQVKADGGSGNKIGAFRGKVAAIGPLLSYTLKAGVQEITLSSRWFHELDVTHRVQGMPSLLRSASAFRPLFRQNSYEIGFARSRARLVGNGQ